MGQFRYILQPYDGLHTRYSCPACGRRQVFSRYIDLEMNEHVAENVGRCNRAVKCGYHLTPKKYFESMNGSNQPLPQHSRSIGNSRARIPEKVSCDRISTIPEALLKKSMSNYENNHFFVFMKHLVGEMATKQAIAKYYVGTSKHWPGATVFWQVDSRGEVRTGQIMLYDPSTGKRVKKPYNHITWAHKVLKMADFELKQCLFGEHLLVNCPGKPVALVESAKTALIASVYLPQFVWLAVSSLTGLSIDRCKVIKEKEVILFPDLNGFEKWESRAKELSLRMPGTSFKISCLLEKGAEEMDRALGLDLADYLIRFDLTTFRKVNQRFL
ncbi:MAG: DUF6371 domain-containing protein [Bacteroidia bacterium]